MLNVALLRVRAYLTLFIMLNTMPAVAAYKGTDCAAQVRGFQVSHSLPHWRRRVYKSDHENSTQPRYGVTLVYGVELLSE